MAALVEGGHFDSTFCGCLGFYLRAMTCNTLPLSVGHLYPRIGKALIHIHRLSRRIGSFCFEGSRRDGHIAKHRYLLSRRNTHKSETGPVSSYEVWVVV
jgi:hypothetical protein